MLLWSFIFLMIKRNTIHRHVITLLLTEGLSCDEGQPDIHVILDEEFCEESSAWEDFDHVVSTQ